MFFNLSTSDPALKKKTRGKRGQGTKKSGGRPSVKRKATGSGSAAAKKARPDVDEIIQVERRVCLFGWLKLDLSIL